MSFLEVTEKCYECIPGFGEVVGEQKHVIDLSQILRLSRHAHGELWARHKFCVVHFKGDTSLSIQDEDGSVYEELKNALEPWYTR